MEKDRISYIDATYAAGVELIKRKIKGEVIMLNLLKFKEIADYSQNPELMPESPITGKAAYQKYMDHTLPYLKKTGGDIIFAGEGGTFLIGPMEESWDYVMIIRQKSIDDFMGFASNEEYLKGLGHRTAALEDSRLLPITESKEKSDCS